MWTTKVVSNKGIAGTYGFPTANLKYAPKMKAGIYAAETTYGPGLLLTKPALSEVHLKNYYGSRSSLVGREISIRLIKMIWSPDTL